MLLTITSHQQPATDLGYLLHKNPERLQSFDLTFGQAHVFYPEAADGCCTAALLLDIDPIGLVRGKHGSNSEGGLLDQYVNDRPYVASSFLSVAIARVFSTALGGRSKTHQQAADAPLPLTAKIAALPCRGGEPFIRALFEPLGYQVTACGHALDERFPEWGESPYFTVELSGTVKLQQLLTHIYVLVPVLDAEKHYWVGDDEVEKLLRHGEGWLAAHPEKETIVKRYLRYRHRLAREALSRLVDEDNPDPDASEEANTARELEIESPLKLWQQRMAAVVDALRTTGAKSVLDLGCGEGKLLREILDDTGFTKVVGMDVSYHTLEIASERLRLTGPDRDRMPAKHRDRLELIHGSLMYKDKRLAGFDAACVVEVIEHLDPPRLAAFERVLFEHARPKHVIITTPNADYNIRFETLPFGQFRHKDHRFEWTRAQFQTWAQSIAERFEYKPAFFPIGPEDLEVGAPTQMGVFSL